MPARQNGAVSSPPARPGLRDILLSLLLLVPVVLVIAGLNRACTFSPAGPTVDPAQLPVVDAPERLREASTRTDFPLRIPALPSGWRANSVNEQAVAGSRLVEVGWITPQGRYLRLVQSNLNEEALLVSAVDRGTPVARGTTEIAGTRWVMYQAEEPVWIADVGGVRLLVSGSASEPDFRTLAAAATTGRVLPVRPASPAPTAPR